MARPLIYPGSDLAAYTQVGPVNQPQKWKRVGDAVTTVTAVVHLQNDPPQNCYILTTGHSFRDRDDNKRNKSTPQHTWNVIGEPDQDRAVGLEHGQDKTAWDLKTRADVFLQNAPIGMSFGRYHCPGDKLNSRTDAGLIRILPNPIPANTFDNTYRNEAGTIAIRITQIAAAWPPAPLAAGQIYFAGNERHLSHNLNPFVNTFDSSFLNWELKQATNLSPADRIILCVDDETTTGGMSGMPLIVYDPHGPLVNGLHQGTLIGIHLGRARDVNTDPKTGTYYSVYQHISAAENLLNIAGLA